MKLNKFVSQITVLHKYSFACFANYSCSHFAKYNFFVLQNSLFSFRQKQLNFSHKVQFYWFANYNFASVPKYRFSIVTNFFLFPKYGFLILQNTVFDVSQNAGLHVLQITVFLVSQNTVLLVS